MKKPISSNSKIANIQEKIIILHKKAQDCVYEEMLLVDFDKNQHLSLYERAIEFLDESIKLDPNLIKTHEFKTYICIMAGKPEKALKSLEIMLKLNPDSKRAKELHQDLISNLQTQLNGNK